MPAPPPILPQIDESEEIINVNEVGELAEEETKNEKLAQAISRLIAFICCIGLPPQLVKVKVQEYADVADETGVSQALIDVIDYYFPDLELTPAVSLLIAGGAFASYVLTDRMQLRDQNTKKQEERLKAEAEKQKERKEK